MTDTPSEHQEGQGEEKHVTRRELGQELRAFRNEVRLLLIGAVVVIRFDVPKELTVAAVGVVVIKAVWSFVAGRVIT